MVKINMDMIQTIGLAVILLLIGMKLRKKIQFFEKYCIPAPVIGGFLFSIIVFIFRQTNVAQIKFDDTLQKFFMVMFFTSVGFNASLKVLKKGGKKVVMFCGGIMCYAKCCCGCTFKICGNSSAARIDDRIYSNDWWTRYFSSCCTYN